MRASRINRIAERIGNNIEERAQFDRAALIIEYQQQIKAAVETLRRVLASRSAK